MSLLLLFGGAQVGNAAPVVEAGLGPRLETTGVQFTLDATVTDDGLPSGTVTLLWTQESGPGVATFVDDTVEDAQVTINLAGTYVLRLTADDTALTGFDEITIIVSDPSVGGGESDSFFWR